MVAAIVSIVTEMSQMLQNHRTLGKLRGTSSGPPVWFHLHLQPPLWFPGCLLSFPQLQHPVTKFYRFYLPVPLVPGSSSSFTVTKFRLYPGLLTGH